jgi:large subunit ribosomal protein L22
MEGKAVQKNIRLSPRKGRRIIPHIQGKSVVEAKMRLDFLPHRAAKIIKKCVHTAASNCIDKAGEMDLREEDLYVKSIRIDEGSKLKRYRPMSFGRAGLIRKRMSHITVEVGKKGDK